MLKRIKDADYYKQKLRRIERKIKALPEGRSENISSDEDSSSAWIVHSGDSSPALDNGEDTNYQKGADQLPEEFLLALGNEGAVKEEVGKPIRPELAVQWRQIMTEGLGQEAQTNIVKKYPTPSNFHNDIAPIMNPEMMATLSDSAKNRDKRIVARQNLTGKLLTCLGRSLTNILNGNIDRKSLIEEINDAAKLAADIHYEDSSGRKFFALSGVDKTTRDIGNNSKTDIFLFGADFAENVKTAQSIHSGVTEIAKRTVVNMQFMTTVKKNGKKQQKNQQPQHHIASSGPHFQQQPRENIHPRQNPPRCNRTHQSEWRKYPWSPARSESRARFESSDRSKSRSRFETPARYQSEYY